MEQKSQGSSISTKDKISLKSFLNECPRYVKISIMDESIFEYKGLRETVYPDADKAALLAAEIDQLFYDYDIVQYRDTVEDRDSQVANIAEDIRNGNTEYLNDFLNAIISDSIREGDISVWISLQWKKSI